MLFAVGRHKSQMAAGFWREIRRLVSRAYRTKIGLVSMEASKP
jgi:hypothetical protein